MLTTRGIVTRRDRFQNTSYLVTWITKDHGIIKTMARGAAKSGHAWGAQIDLFHECDLQIRLSRSSDIQTLSEVQLLNSNAGLRQGYERLLAAHYAVELIEAFVEIRTPIPEIYELLLKAVDYLSDKGPSLQLIERYERRLLIIAGHHDGSEGRSTMELLRSSFIKIPESRKQLLTYLK